MKLRKLFAVLMLSVFCLSGCSNQLKEVAEMEKEIEQTTTTAAVVEKKIGETVQVSDSEPDMSEKWEVVNGGENYSPYDSTMYDAYGFVNESGFQFACSVFLPEQGKSGKEKCPAVLLETGMGKKFEVDEDGIYVEVMYPSYYKALLLARALNEEGIALIVIEPFGSMGTFGTFLDIANAALENTSQFEVKGNEYDNSFTADKGFMDVVLDHIPDISGVDDSKIFLTSTGYHNIAATQIASKNPDKIAGLIMIDPCTGLTDKIRKEYPDKGSLKGIEDDKAGMGTNYLYELYDIDLKEESSKLNVNTKIFISDELRKADTTDPLYDHGIVNGTLATSDSAESYYPGSAPKILDSTDFSYMYNPPDKVKNSIQEVVLFCKMLAQK